REQANLACRQLFPVLLNQFLQVLLPSLDLRHFLGAKHDYLQTFLFRVDAKHPCTVGTCIPPDTTIDGVDEAEFLPDTVVLLEPAHNVQTRAASLVYQLTMVINLSVHH